MTSKFFRFRPVGSFIVRFSVAAFVVCLSASVTLADSQQTYLDALVILSVTRKQSGMTPPARAARPTLAIGATAAAAAMAESAGRVALPSRMPYWLSPSL